MGNAADFSYSTEQNLGKWADSSFIVYKADIKMWSTFSVFMLTVDAFFSPLGLIMSLENELAPLIEELRQVVEVT